MLVAAAFLFAFDATAKRLLGQDKSSVDTNNRKFEFELPGVLVKSVGLSHQAESATVVVFLGTECPLAKLYASRLSNIAEEYVGKVQFLGINSNQQDSLGDLKRFIKDHKIGFPIGKDLQNKVADRYGAIRTPEVFLLDENLNLLYRGRVDDQYSPGISRSNPSQRFLVNAIDELLAGKPISVAKTDVVGCLIGRTKKLTMSSTVTYCKQVSRVLQKHCVECHRHGEIGPFSLTDYEEVAGWADMIVEVVEEQRMPPWHANPKHGDFKNSRLMTAKEKQILKDWANAGTPYGNQTDLPQPKKFTSGWQLPKKPDLIVSMRKRPFEVPADGTVEYQYFVVDPGFKEDKWISAAQVLPGNNSVVHHSIVFVRPPDGRRFRGIGWLGAYVPGQRSTTLPNHHARFVPAGSKLVFQQHYTPNGSAQLDTTKIGLVFADEKNVTHEAMTLAGLDQEFEIPPNTANYLVEASLRYIPKEGSLLSISPHMHLRGKTFRAMGVVDGHPKVLCDVPNYDFNWQHSYRFARPINLAKLDSLKFEVTFDNSIANPVNPDPNQYVTWGDQSFEEMAVAFFDVAVPRIKRKRDSDGSSLADRDSEFAEKADDVVSERVVEFVDRFIDRFDKNKNGTVERAELPISTRSFGFWQIDSNQDEKLTRDEVVAVAKRRIK